MSANIDKFAVKVVSAVLTNIIAMAETQNMDPFINILYIFSSLLLF